MRYKINLDALGIATSLACAIHCALLPVFVSSLPIFGVELIENSIFEMGMIALAFCIGIYSLYHGYKKHHHSLLPMVIFLIAFTFLILKMFIVQYERWLLLPAAAGIIAAHLVNYKFCRIHNHAHPEHCDHQ